MKTIKNTALFAAMIFCFGPILAEEVAQPTNQIIEENDITIEQYLNDLANEQQKSFAELAKTHHYNLGNKNLSSLCKDQEALLTNLRIATYEQNLLKNNIRVSKDEYVDFLKSVGVSEKNAELLATYDKIVTIQNTSSFLSKFCFISIGVTALCLIIKDIKKSLAEKRKQKQKKQQEIAVDREEIVTSDLPR